MPAVPLSSSASTSSSLPTSSASSLTHSNTNAPSSNLSNLNNLNNPNVNNASPTHVKKMMRRSPRQIWWGGLFITSLIAMGSTFEAVRLQRHYSPPNQAPTSTQRWSISSTLLTFLLTLLTLSFQAIPRFSHKLTGTKLELTLILIIMGFTCASTGAATNPATGLAVNGNGGVSFGNLYYSTWGSFGCAFALLLSFIRTERGLDVSHELLSRGKRFRSWVVLIVVNIIVMGSSASAYDARCDVVEEMKPKKYCHRAAFGVSAGCFGCVLSLVMVAVRLSCAEKDDGNKMVFTAEALSSAVLFCTYGFAVAYLTSEKGPGAPLGNLYYSSWITFGITFFVATSCFEEYQSAKSMIVTRRRQQQQQASMDDSDVSEREGLSIADTSTAGLTDQGRVGAGPMDWSDRDNNLGGDWNFIGDEEKRQASSASAFGRRNGSVGEVHIDMD